MIINQLNSRNYDTRNFDKYKNFYAILVDEKRININAQLDKDAYENIHIKFDQRTTLLVYTNSLEELSDHNNDSYKIVYGHFYNNNNEFLFKKCSDGKIIGYKVHRCKARELWRNELDQLYISNYFDTTKKTALLLNQDNNKEVRSKFKQKQTIGYEFIDNTLNFGVEFMNVMSSIYNTENELLQLNAISNKIKILN